NDLNSFSSVPIGIKKLTIFIEKERPFTARTLFIYPSAIPFKAEVAVQVNGANGFKTVRTFQYDRTNFSKNVGFKPQAPVVIHFYQQTSDAFRLVLTGISGTGGFAEIFISNAARI